MVVNNRRERRFVLKFSVWRWENKSATSRGRWAQSRAHPLAFPLRLPNFAGGYSILGSWVIDGVAAGLGIRESKTPVTDNLSCFVPHLFG
ncbi:MAG: glutathionylspermidine synthase family protein [Deltaproteobacteria bacterium]|nr:glutathionylspermidine synthase family protein [Deltaproteobacteria bacterium]